MFKLKIKTDNAAFQNWDERGPYATQLECARLLAIIAGQLELGHAKHAIFDLNGNNVGEWSLS